MKPHQIVVLSLAQKRNWSKRLVKCYTAGYQSIIKKYKDSLTSQEITSIEAMVTTGTLLLSAWLPKKEDTQL